MEYTTLNNGIKMPMVGFGVFQIPDPTVCQEVVEEAIKTGYRLIDTARAYGNEEAVGKAIKASDVPRVDSRASQKQKKIQLQKISVQRILLELYFSFIN